MDGNRSNDPSEVGAIDADWQDALDHSGLAVLALQDLVIEAAKALYIEFNQVRLQGFREASSARNVQPQRTPAVWSPLQFRYRDRPDKDRPGHVVSMTLGWQLCHGKGSRANRRKKYGHIPTHNRGRHYDPYVLFKHARPHERDLVVATERRAVAIRKLWAAVVAMRANHRTLADSRAAQPVPLEP